MESEKAHNFLVSYRSRSDIIDPPRFPAHAFRTDGIKKNTGFGVLAFDRSTTNS
jgi:hypothetical protein